MFLCFEYVGTFGICCFDNRGMFLRSQNFQLPLNFGLSRCVMMLIPLSWGEFLR